MVNLPERHFLAKWMPVMLGGGLVAALAAAVLLVFASRAENADRGYRTHLAELTVLAGAMPAQAAAARRGDPAGFERLAASRAQLERVLGEIEEGRSPFAALSSESARRLGDEPGWTTVLDASQQVLAAKDGRWRAAQVRQRFARDPRTRARGDRKCRFGAGRHAGDARAAALRDGRAAHERRPRTARGRRSIPPRSRGGFPRTRRCSSQFLAGLAGLDKTAGVPAIEGEAATRLGEVRDAFAAYEKQLQGTLERAGALATAQRAAGDLATAADRLSKSLETLSASGAGGSGWRDARTDRDRNRRSSPLPARCSAGSRRPACGASRASSRSAIAATRTRSSGCSTRCRASPTAT